MLAALERTCCPARVGTPARFPAPPPRTAPPVHAADVTDAGLAGTLQSSCMPLTMVRHDYGSLSEVSFSYFCMLLGHLRGATPPSAKRLAKYADEKYADNRVAQRNSA